MGIVRLTLDQITQDTTLPEAIPKPDSSVFNTLIPETISKSLLKYIEGYPWTVNYYGQILGRENTLSNFDPNKPDLNQQYYEILNLIIQVTSPLTSTYDPSTGSMRITGSAVLPYKMHPNVGDMFLAKVDSGQDAIFLIDSVVRKTFIKETIYEVTYNLIFYLSQSPNFYNSLKSRVVNTYYFNKDTNYFNRDHLITPSVKEARDRLIRYLDETLDYYMERFTYSEAGTILVPGTKHRDVNDSFYDPKIIDFIMKIIDTDKIDYTKKMKYYRYPDERHIDDFSILDVLIERNINRINNIRREYVFIDNGFRLSRARLGHIGYTLVRNILYPKRPYTQNSVGNITIDPLGDSSSNIDVRNPNNYFMPTSLTINSVYNNNIYTKNILHELFLDDYYIVTENFYNFLNDDSYYNDISYIEFLIYKFLRKEAIAKEDLVLVIETYNSWSLLHQFYLLPVMWLIIKANL
ncbi:MAG: hypothetical protein QW350_05825 [Candidatus Aenigmatarchaeota archaeon]